MIAQFEVLQWVIQGGLVLGTAYGGVKVAMNGFAKRLDRMEGKQDSQAEVLNKHGERLASIEARLSPPP